VSDLAIRRVGVPTDPRWLSTTNGTDSGLPMRPGGEADPITSPDEPVPSDLVGDKGHAPG
jgi:hypothetical protein